MTVEQGQTRGSGLCGRQPIHSFSFSFQTFFKSRQLAKNLFQLTLFASSGPWFSAVISTMHGCLSWQTLGYSVVLSQYIGSH